MKMFLKKWSCTLQHDASDCAAAAVSTILLSYKNETTIAKIRETIGTDAYGTTVKGIVDGLDKFGFSVKAVKTTTDNITPELTYPAIAQVQTKEGLPHFVVIHKVKKNGKMIIADPAVGVSYYDKDEFDDIFLGVMIFMVPTSPFEKSKVKDKGMVDLFIKLILPQKKLIAVIILASILLTLFGIISSFFSKIIMDEIIPYELKNSLFVFLIIFVVVSLIHNLISFFREQILLFLSRKIDIPIMLGYYDHIMHLPYRFFGSRKIGDIITRFQDALTIKSIFTTVAITLILDISLAALSSVLLYSLNKKLFLILIVMVFINVVLVYIFKKPYRKINYEQMEAAAMLNAQLIDSIRNIDIVKSHGDEKEQMAKLEQRFVHSLKIGYKEGVLQNAQGLVASTINSIGNVFMIGIGALLIINKEITIGDLLVFQSLSQFFINPIQNLVSLQITFQEAQVAMNRLRELMSLDREDTKRESVIKDVDLNRDIVFNNVTFSYGSRPPILKDFNLEIKQGEKVAIVGESGAGKSTLAKLLLRFFDVNEGEVLIGEHSIYDIDNQYLRKRIAYIPQDINLFTGTILDNLRVGNPSVKFEEIVSACKLSGAANFIDRLQNRYQSFVEEGGGNLSGGEKQRLAIARALIGKKDIYIFDEATSNLDSFSEKVIQDVIFNRIKDKTTIIIAHRLSTIINCDRIFFVEKGKIVESGSHAELMNLKGKYFELVRAQADLTLGHPSNDTKRDYEKGTDEEDNGVISYE